MNEEMKKEIVEKLLENQQRFLEGKESVKTEYDKFIVPVMNQAARDRELIKRLEEWFIKNKK
jgi:hypothetical protein